MGFKYYIYDPNMWMIPEVKPNYEEYYEYFLTYIDDFLVISINIDTEMNQVQERFNVKNDKVE